MFTPEERLNYVYAFVKYAEKDITLDFWQDDFIKNTKRFVCILKSRRTGFSFATALKGLIKAMDPARVDYTKLFVSYNKEDALEKIRYAKAFYESIPARCKKKLITDNKTCLEFLDLNGKTKSRLVSMPCRAPRGKGGDICLDEFAIYGTKLSNEIYTAALPVISRGGCFEAGSTPLGKIGKFYEIYNDRANFNQYTRYFVAWWMCASLCTNVPLAIQECPAMATADRVAKFGTETIKETFASMSIDAFQQEYECVFIDSNESYITLDLIDENTPGRTKGEDLEVFHNVDDLCLQYNPNIHGSEIFVGYDVARSVDAISIIGLSRGDNTLRMLFRFEEHNKTFEWQEKTIARLLQELPITRCTMDSTGQGAPIYESLHRTFGDKIEGFNFTLQSKEVLAMEVKKKLERKEYELENDRGFHAQLHSIKRMPAIAGHFRYDAERSEGLHADSFWSLALATYAVTRTTQRFNFYKEYAKRKEVESIGTWQKITLGKK